MSSKIKGEDTTINKKKDNNISAVSTIIPEGIAITAIKSIK